MDSEKQQKLSRFLKQRNICENKNKKLEKAAVTSN